MTHAGGQCGLRERARRGAGACARRRTEHDVARADEDDVEVIGTADVGGPGKRVARISRLGGRHCDARRTHLSMGISLEGSMEGLREDVPDWRRDGESKTDGRRKDVGLVSSDGRRDMVYAGAGVVVSTTEVRVRRARTRWQEERERARSV